ncbi:MAG: ABC transporter substrate-binding protein [Actinomycetaceae bacterium]|nr:ABC transporter substrate-binding protein [Actinomycetaceae bacterium]
MRRIVAVLGAVALTASLAACGGGDKKTDTGADGTTPPADDGGKKVGVVTWWSAGSEKDGLAALENVFKEQNPDITFENQAVSGGSGSNAKQKLQTDLAAKNPPDTYQAHAGAELSSDIEAGYLEDVSNLYDEFNLRNAFPATLLDRLTVDGKIYSVPSNVHRGNVVWVSPAALEKAGLDPKTPPANLDAWIADMEKLKAAGVEYPITVGADWTQLQLLETVLISDLGAEGYNGLFSGTTQWDSADVTKALEHFSKIMSFTDPGLYQEDWEPAMKSIINNDGKVAYNVMGDWAPAAFKAAEKKWSQDFYTWPVPGNEGVFDFLADSFTLPVGAKNIDGAKAWLKTISSVEGQIAFNVIKGSIPARSDLTPEQIAEFSEYQQDAMKSFGNDTIVSSIAHGAAVSIASSEAMKQAISKFTSGGATDIATLQKELVDAATK